MPQSEEDIDTFLDRYFPPLPAPEAPEFDLPVEPLPLSPSPAAPAAEPPSAPAPAPEPLQWLEKEGPDGEDLRNPFHYGIILDDIYSYSGPSEHPSRIPPPQTDSKNDPVQPSRGCLGTSCLYYPVYFVGHRSVYCSNALKCIIRSARKHNSRVESELAAKKDDLPPFEYLEYLFEHLSWDHLTESETNFVDSLEYGDYGFRSRGHLTPRQLKFLERIFISAKSKEMLG